MGTEPPSLGPSCSVRQQGQAPAVVTCSLRLFTAPPSRARVVLWSFLGYRYLMVGLSPPVVVNPPFDISPYSPGVQFGLGLLWTEFEASMASMGQLLNRPAPQPTCNSCLCTYYSVPKLRWEVWALALGSVCLCARAGLRGVCVCCCASRRCCVCMPRACASCRAGLRMLLCVLSLQPIRRPEAGLLGYE
jgi:hypothetical protein